MLEHGMLGHGNVRGMLLGHGNVRGMLELGILSTRADVYFQ